MGCHVCFHDRCTDCSPSKAKRPQAKTSLFCRRLTIATQRTASTTTVYRTVYAAGFVSESCGSSAHHRAINPKAAEIWNNDVARRARKPARLSPSGWLSETRAGPTAIRLVVPIDGASVEQEAEVLFAPAAASDEACIAVAKNLEPECAATVPGSRIGDQVKRIPTIGRLNAADFA